jgi:uncharacterized cupredoxin-like copper-binding protein
MSVTETHSVNSVQGPARHRLRPLLATGLAIGALALVTAACGSSSTGTSGTTAGTTAAVAPATSGSGSASSSETGNQVTVSLTEFHLTVSDQTLAAGTYTFAVTNSGTVTHALEITGPGVSGQHTGNLGPGQSANLTVTLKAGSYDVFCPIDGHKGLGMDLQLTVSGGGSGGGGGAGTTTTTTGGGGGYGS